MADTTYIMYLQALLGLQCIFFYPAIVELQCIIKTKVQLGGHSDIVSNLDTA